jgi:outer membrane protein TolC
MQRSFGIAVLAAAQIAGAPAWGDRGHDDDTADRAESTGIDDLIDAAVRRSPDLIRIRAERRAARELAKAAAAPDQWRLAASVDWGSGTAARVPGQPVQQVGQTTIATQVGATKTLPTGGELQLTLAHTRLYQRYAVARDTQAAGGPTEDAIAETIGHVAVARIGVVQPLLRGRGATVSRADRHRAELAAEASQIRARYDAAVLIHDLVDDYWEVAFADAVIDVRRDSIKAAREQLEAARDLWKAGVLPVSGLKAAEYAVLEREESLLRAQMDLEERSLAARQLAGLEVGPHDIALDPTDPLALDDTDWRVDDVLATAREHNPRIEGARLGIKLADIDVALGEDARSPAVDFRASAAAIGGGQDFGGSIEGVGQPEAYELSAGIAVRYEIGGAASALGNAAREAHTAALTAVEVVERDVTVSVVRAVHRVRAARKRTEVAGKAIEVSVANLKAEQAAFKAGRTTSYIVLERQTEVDEARLLRARAIADYHQAVARVELESGELLARWGVVLRDKR